MAGLIVKSMSSIHQGYDRMIDVLNNEITTLTSEIKLTNDRYKDALIDRNHLFRECRRLRAENRRLTSRIDYLKLREK